MHRSTALTLVLALVLATLAGIPSGSSDVAASTAQASPGYTLVDLGALVQAGASKAYGLNDAGQVVGEAQTASGDWHAVKWESGSGVTDLGTLGGATSRAYAVNSAGDVAGASVTASGATHAVVWRSGTLSDLGTLPGGDWSEAYDLNDSGQVVGVSEAPIPGGGYAGYRLGFTLHAVWWDQSGIHDLGTLGGSSARAAAINATGQVAGIAYTVGGSGKLFSSAVLAQVPAPGQAAPAVPLATLPGGWTSDAYDINAAGAVAGYAYVPSPTSYAHAVVWSGAPADLGSLPGLPYSAAYAIDGAGQVVGTATDGFGTLSAFRELGTTAGSRAVLWQDGVAWDLTAFLSTAADWTLQVARDINASGWITGVGVHNGVTSAFLLMPEASPSVTPTPTPTARPEPTSSPTPAVTGTPSPVASPSMTATATPTVAATSSLPSTGSPVASTTVTPDGTARPRSALSNVCDEKLPERGNDEHGHHNPQCGGATGGTWALQDG